MEARPTAARLVSEEARKRACRRVIGRRELQGEVGRVVEGDRARSGEVARQRHPQRLFREARVRRGGGGARRARAAHAPRDDSARVGRARIGRLRARARERVSSHRQLAREGPRRSGPARARASAARAGRRRTRTPRRDAPRRARGRGSARRRTSSARRSNAPPSTRLGSAPSPGRARRHPPPPPPPLAQCRRGDTAQRHRGRTGGGSC